MRKSITEKYGFTVGMRVILVSNSKPGVVSKVSNSFVYVKFDNRITVKGQACYPQDLERE